jgi:hypothetical protein
VAESAFDEKRAMTTSPGTDKKEKNFDSFPDKHREKTAILSISARINHFLPATERAQRFVC